MGGIVNENGGRIKVLHVITRMEEGGAPRALLSLLDGIDGREFDQSLAAAAGPMGSDLLGCGRALGIDVCEIRTFTREVSPVKDVLSLLSLVALMRKNRYDIIHTHTSKAGFLGRLAGRLAGHRRVIYSPHGNIFTGYFPRWEAEFYTLMERIAAGWCQRIVTLSDAGRREFLERGIGTEDRYRTIYNGIDLEAFGSAADRRGVRNELGFGDKDLVIVCVGRMVPIKGYDTVVKASQKIISGMAPRAVRFLMVGEGPLKVELTEKARALEVGGNFTFPGFRDDVSRLLSASDLMVMPSLNEGLGMSIVEAMALSLPVVASRVGGIVEVVEDGVTGMLVPPSSPVDLAKACVGILRDKERAERMGRAGRVRAESLFDIKSMVKNTEALYRELMEEG
ncbi:MAG: glycosyltransferase family 4 protein [Deltaproteobacteria bacterium]|uniref:Glycosyltransferase family 4 protein n=1 Tax=Candidatus Zymogenus saltonus TaxID=2844893 RepID=A0A9D8KFN5_9DELT|nr:glycosyltransferase family 4 protein [Candidatus Zymogenus saltonus]